MGKCLVELVWWVPCTTVSLGLAINAELEIVSDNL